MLGAGQKSMQMHQAYVHLQASNTGAAFGTAARVTSIEKKKSASRSKCVAALCYGCATGNERAGTRDERVST